MRLLGIEFADIWNTPIERRLQTLSVWIFFYSLLFTGFTAICFFYYCFFHTTYLWPLTCLYLAWFVWDLDTCNQGGRRSNWFRKAHLGRHFANYFPVKLVKTAEIDASKGNYLLGSHPHGLLCSGAVAAFSCEGANFSQIFPELTPTLLTLEVFHFMPAYRELGQVLGICAATSKSLDYLLGYGPQKKGRAVVLIVGGAREVLCQDKDKIDLVILKRKGFIKKALKHGSDLVPTFSFGESFLYNAMWPNPKGSWTRTIQEFIVSKTRWPVPFFIGRDVFQYTFGILPHRRPITVVVGGPIPTAKVDEPSQEEIDALHAKYLEALRDLYDQYNPLYGDPKVELNFI